MNNCTFVGNLTKDAQTKTRQDGSAYLMFSIAVNEVRGQEKKAIYITCFVTHYSPNLVQYLRKGTKVGVAGSISAAAYIAPDGVARPDLSLSVWRVELCGGERAQQDGQGYAPQYAQQAPQPQPQPQMPTRPQQAPQTDMFAPQNMNTATPPNGGNDLPF